MDAILVDADRGSKTGPTLLSRIAGQYAFATVTETGALPTAPEVVPRIRQGVAIATDSNGRVYILDAIGPILVRLTPVGGRFAIETRSLNLAAASDLCVTGEYVFVFGRRSPSGAGPLIHRYSVADLAAAGSFGDDFSRGGPPGTPVPGAGRILCSPEGQLLIAVLTLAPEVRAYALSGQLQWRVSVPAFEAVAVILGAGGSGVTFDIEPQTPWDQTIALWDTPSGALGVQHLRRVGLSPIDAGTLIATVIMDPATGSLIGGGTDLPLLLAPGPGGTAIVTGSGQPYSWPAPSWATVELPTNLESKNDRQ